MSYLHEIGVLYTFDYAHYAYEYNITMTILTRIGVLIPMLILTMDSSTIYL